MLSFILSIESFLYLNLYSHVFTVSYYLLVAWYFWLSTKTLAYTYSEQELKTHYFDKMFSYRKKKVLRKKQGLGKPDYEGLRNGMGYP